VPAKNFGFVESCKLQQITHLDLSFDQRISKDQNSIKRRIFSEQKTNISTVAYNKKRSAVSYYEYFDCKQEIFHQQMIFLTNKTLQHDHKNSSRRCLRVATATAVDAQGWLACSTINESASSCATAPRVPNQWTAAAPLVSNGRLLCLGYLMDGCCTSGI
jgi:hypothetical protein